MLDLLSTLALIAMSGARVKARDVKRIADFRQIETAMNVFFGKYSLFPCGKGGGFGSNAFDLSGLATFLDGANITTGPSVLCPNAPYTGIKTEGIVTGPIGEMANPTAYVYEVSSNRQTYIIYAVLENNVAAMQNDGGMCTNLYEMGNGKGFMRPDWETLVGVAC